ncbi:MAG: tRNA pseudouridine(55) synthase TruB, partial [Lachnospiraceae bacterium]|nr:tRNA pseudouridine(55) synthase TruB [Lachnospiraceae bacterium]
MKSGIIIIDKEKGFTSFDVIAKLRGILKTKKLGHTGTLDPDATGVLPVCIGKATKVCDLLTDRSKTYETVLLLGQATDTQDISGTILHKANVEVTEDEVKNVIASMVGKQLQTPPMYSAKKVDGRKLYELAREGVEVHREPSAIEVFSIDILWMELPRVAMRISCSKGTYIRTICNDIGEKLGCFGCMEALRRTRVGEFDLEGAFSLEEVEEMMREGTVEDHIYSIDTLFHEYE